MIQNPQAAEYLIDWFREQGLIPIPLKFFRINDDSSKEPLLKHWLDETIPRETIMEYVHMGHSVGLRIPDDVLVIDVDVREDGDGREAWNRLAEIAGLQYLQTLCTWSDHGGMHFYYRIPADMKVRAKVPGYDRLDFLYYGKQVVMPGCSHWRGGIYSTHFDQIANNVHPGIAEAPPALLELIRRPEKEYIGNTDSVEFTPAEIRDLLSMLDVTLFRGQGGAAWPQLMFAVHNACRGSEEGLQVWLEWCTSDPQYADHAESIKKRWESADADAVDGVTSGTLLGWARWAAGEKEDQRAANEALHMVATIEAMHDFNNVSTKEKVAAEAAVLNPDVVEDAPEPEFKDKVVIRVQSDVNETANEIEKLFPRIPHIYQRDGKLVTLVRDKRPPGSLRAAFAPRVSEIGKDELYDMVAAQANFVKVGSKGNRSIEAPVKPIHCLLARRDWRGASPIRQVVTAPCLLPDGSVLQTAGLNRQYGIFYAPSADYPQVPHRPTYEQAREAMDLMLEMMVDFPFMSLAHRSNALALMFTLACRSSYLGSTPLFVFDGNQAGVGKSLIAWVCTMAMTGTDAPMMACPVRDEEMRKELTTMLLHAEQIRVIDNVRNGKEINFPSLDQMITSEVLETRILGTMDSSGRMENNTTLVLTGNNVRFAVESDLGRRVAYCRLSYDGANPESRSRFQHGSESTFRNMIRTRHPELVTAALTVLRAYRQEGSPIMDIPNMGGFGAWTLAVRQPLVWMGEADPLDSWPDFRDQADAETESLEDLFEAWFQAFGDRLVPTREILESRHRVDESGQPLKMQDVIDLYLDPAQTGSMRTVGNAMKRYAGKWQNGMKLENFREKSGRGWRMVLRQDREKELMPYLQKVNPEKHGLS